MTLRAALYHRVSTTDQDATLARSELRAAAKRYGATVSLSVEETGSGASNDRPGHAKVMDAARRGRVDMVIVWKLDRFGRSALDLLSQLDELEKLGVRFIATTQGLDLQPGGDAMSKLMLQVLASVAEFERELIRERTRAGLERARERGAQLGRPKVGRPDRAVVEELRAQRISWRIVARRLGCSVYACRQALVEGAESRQTRLRLV